MSDHTDDELSEWWDFLRRAQTAFHVEMRPDSTHRPNAWPRRFHLWRFWR